MTPLLQDLRYAVRSLLKRPGFTLVAVATLAIGTGGTTAVLGIASALFRGSLPVPEAERVVSLVQPREDGTTATAFTHPDYLAYRAASEAHFSELAATGNSTFGLRTATGAETVPGVFVSGNYFRMLGIQPALGRFLLPDDDASGHAAVAVLGHAAWQRRFSGDPAVVGRTVHLNGHPVTVVGVAGAEFRGTQMTVVPEFWVPVAAREFLVPGLREREGGRVIWLGVHGRLRDAVEPRQAEAALAAVAARLAEAAAEGEPAPRVALVRTGGIPAALQGTVSGLTGILLIASTLVFLIAATNVAGMLLARAAGRRREIAIRLAIGAGRGRLVRQVLTESGLLFVAGGAAGVLLAFWLTRLASVFLLAPGGPLPLHNLDPTPDAAVLAAAFLLSLTAGVAFGLAPALEAVRTDLTPALKDASAAAGRRRAPLRSAMVAGQVGMTVLLLLGAGLFIRSLQQAARVDLGLDPAGVLVGRISLLPHGYDEARGLAFYRDLEARVGALPGVQRVAFADSPPLSGMTVSTGVAVGGGESEALMYNPVSEGYFDALGIPLLRGRLFGPADRAGGPEVAVVTEAFVRRYFPSGDPVGATVHMSGVDVEIVGVVRDSRWSGLEEEDRPFAYRPLAQDYAPAVALLVRATGPAAQLEAGIRREMQALHPDVPLHAATTLDAAVRQFTLSQRVAAWAAAAFGGVGLVLALVGLYGVLAYAVGQRTREIGIRVALGASAPAVATLVLRQGMLLVGMGAMLGLAASLPLRAAVRGLLLGVRPGDPLTVGGVLLLMAAVAAAASYFPARRAARVDPIVALRAE